MYYTNSFKRRNLQLQYFKITFKKFENYFKCSKLQLKKFLIELFILLVEFKYS